jgi:hypothetical protein
MFQSSLLAMEDYPVKKISLLVCLLTFCSPALLAQAPQHPRILHAPKSSATPVPPQERPAGLQPIFSNLNKSLTDLYNQYDGWTISGPNSSAGTSFIALPFIPKSNSHAVQIRVPVHYVGSGANQVDLSLYTDANGAPGTLLAGPVTVTNLALWGTCCTLTVASFPPVALTAGTQYWMVADTPLTGTGSDFYGTWDFIAPNLFLEAGDSGAGWYPFDGLNNNSAGEVLGTIP